VTRLRAEKEAVRNVATWGRNTWLPWVADERGPSRVPELLAAGFSCGRVPGLPRGRRAPDAAWGGLGREGRAVEGHAVEGHAVEGHAVEGRAVEGRAVEGRAGEGSSVGVEGRSCPPQVTTQESSAEGVGEGGPEWAPE